MRKLLLISTMLLVSVPALAFDIPLSSDARLNVYGSIKTLITYNMLSIDNPEDVATPFTLNQLKFMMQPDTKFGADFTYSNFFAKLELGYNAFNNETLLGIRQAYGGIDMGRYGRFTIGQLPSSSSYSMYFNDVFTGDNRLVSFGATTQEFVTAITYRVYDIELGIVDMGAQTVVLPDNVTKAGSFLLPRVELSYQYDQLDWLFLKVFGMYANYNTKIKTGVLDEAGNPVTGNNKEVGTNAFHAGAFARFKMGIFGIQVGGFASYNGHLYGAVKSALPGMGVMPILSYQNITPNYLVAGADADAAAGQKEGDYLGIDGVLAFGGALGLSLKATSFLTIEVGGGLQLASADYLLNADGTAVSIMNAGGYANLAFAVHPNFRITPQFGFYLRSSDAVGYQSNTAIVGGLQVMALF